MADKGPKPVYFLYEQGVYIIAESYVSCKIIIPECPLHFICKIMAGKKEYFVFLFIHPADLEPGVCIDRIQVDHFIIQVFTKLFVFFYGHYILLQLKLCQVHDISIGFSGKK